MIKKIMICFVTLSILSGCTLTNNKFTIKKENIQKYLQEKNGYATPMDNIYDIKLTCFEQTNGNNFKESHNVSASQSIGELIRFQSSFKIKDRNNTILINTDESEDGIQEEQDDDFGDFLEFYLSEDLNGEYLASINYSKKELKRLKKTDIPELNVISTILIEQEYYPTNKLPYKIFENEQKTDVCFLTVRW